VIVLSGYTPYLETDMLERMGVRKVLQKLLRTRYLLDTIRQVEHAASG